MRDRVPCAECAPEIAEMRRQSKSRRLRDDAKIRALTRAIHAAEARATAAERQAEAAKADLERIRERETRASPARPVLKLRHGQGGHA
jgi:RNA 3'-terminal phosphate cyclase